eukprot:3734696-Ditylum_brightwellii.AAC.1
MLRKTLHLTEAVEGTPGAQKIPGGPQQQDATDLEGDLQQDQVNLWMSCRCLPTNTQECTHSASLHAML